MGMPSQPYHWYFYLFLFIFDFCIGRGFMKMMRERFEGVNIVPIDYDTSASEVSIYILII
jgi:hypothetical protein